MLTSIFYYNYYKPYRIGGITQPASSAEKYSQKKSQIASVADYNSGKPIVRNRAIKSDVVSYACDFSFNVTDIKDTAKFLFQNSESVKLAARTEGMDSAVEWAKEDISAFVKSFNRAKGFSYSQNHSYSLQTYMSDVDMSIDMKADELKKMGISKDKEGMLVFDESVIDGYSYNQLSEAYVNANDAVNDIYNKTTEFLTRPLSEHMNFQSLNYYYNYELGTVSHNSFQLIDTGMIFDCAV